MKFLVCSRNMTEVVNLIEDILSDEYEEGEILDEDILYENVSSLEEFSDPEDKRLEVKTSKSDVKKSKNRRKKEHKCKEESLCRKERSGKHCYARIRLQRSSLDCKFKNSGRGLSSDVEKKSRPAARPASPTRGSAKRDSFNKEATKGNGKQDDRSRYPPYYFQHDNRNRTNPPRRNISVRRPLKTRRISADDRRDHDRKRKSRSPSPRSSVKHLHEASRAVAKTSLLDRLVWSGSIPQKTGGSCEADDCSGKAELNVAHPSLSVPSDQEKSRVSGMLEPVDTVKEPLFEGGNPNEKNEACCMNNLCPEDIPVPPTPKATSPLPEPPKEEIDELHLRLVALKTAIMKKQNDFKRKKRLAASKKSYTPGNDSFVEFALMGDDDLESIPTPPPPGTDCWPPPTVRDLDDPRWSDEDMVIDQESTNGDTIIEANIPATDSVLPNSVTFSLSASSPSSQDKLPCCKGNPIPVVSQHRPAKEIDERRPALSSSTSVIIPVQEIAPPPVIKETPKYLKEINSNLKSGMKRRRTARRPRQRRRRNFIRQRTPVVKRIEKSAPRKEHVARKHKIFEGDDDEDALRQLALMSVKPKNTITGGMLAKINENLNPLHIDTDPAALVIKPESPAKNPSPEAWEDLDEDILRAQLLSSLTRNIPEAPSQPPLPPAQAIPAKRVVIERAVPLRKDVLIKRLNKENVYTKRNVVVHPNVKSSKRNSKKYINPNTKSSLAPQLNHPVIEKFIIRVSESESSEDEEKTVRGKIVSDFEDSVSQKMDLESSIDKLLEEARKETELIQKATPYYPMCDCPGVLPEMKVETTPPLCDVTDVTSGLPSLEVDSVENTLVLTNADQDESPIADPKNEEDDSRESREGTSHLPAWQQEEFERQKRVMARKESIIAAAKEKIRAKNCLVASSLLTNLPRDLVRNETDETNTTSAVTVQMIPVVEESSGSGSIEKVADCQSSVNTIELFEAKEVTVDLSDDEGCCIQREINSCMETLLSKVCAEMDAGYAGNSAVTGSSLELDVAGGMSNSEADPGNEGGIEIGIGLKAANTSSLPVATDKTSRDEAPVPVDSKVSGNTELPSRLPLQQQKKRLQNRTLQIHNPVASKETRVGTNPITVAPKKSPVRGTLPTIQKQIQLPVLATARQPVSSLPNGTVHSAVKKHLFAVRDSSYALKGLNEMNDLVSGLEKGMSEYTNIKKDFNAQRKQLMLTQQKMSEKRQLLLEMKDKIENRKRLLQSTISMDTSSLSPLPDNKDQQKQSSRASELLTLKFKEVCLKAQFAMMGLETASRPQASVKMSRPAEDLNQSPRKKLKLRARPVARPAPKAAPMLKPGQSDSADPGTSHKLVVSVRDSDKMDPLVPLCPYDMKGVCKDEECQYQHLKN